MSTREEDSSPSRPLVSARPTARDVPIAKYKEVGVGTSPPRGLRGQSLQPGQGAPERVNPEDVELAVLRAADTIDGPKLPRPQPRRSSSPELSSSPPPTPVSVEVPRMRSVPPALEVMTPTPLTPSARSVQSGTLMSIGSIDPRAPTELSLPSPRALSHSERAAYVGPGAVVDRAATSQPPSVPRDLPRMAMHSELAARVPVPRSEPQPQSSARTSQPASNARPSHRADSPAPVARHFARGPDSYSPVERGQGAPRESRPAHSPRDLERVSQPPASGGPRFEIHSELEALPREFLEDNFDLRSVVTQREPLASRKPISSSDWTPTAPHEPVPSRRDSTIPSERTSHNPSSSSAITILVDPRRPSFPDARDSIPSAFPPPPRATVPLGWVLGAAAFAVLLALGVAWIMRQPAPEAARSRDSNERAAALGAAQPSLQAAVPAAATAPVATLSRAPTPPVEATSSASALPTAVPKATPALLAKSPEMPASSAARPAAALSARPVDLHAAPAAPAEPASKSRQSIY